MKYTESFGWKYNNYYYCCHDYIIGEETNTYGYPYKLVTSFDSDSYYYFLESEDTVKDLISYFLKFILGYNYSSSKDYNAFVMYQGTKLSLDTALIHRFKTKIENNVVFWMRQIL